MMAATRLELRVGDGRFRAEIDSEGLVRIEDEVEPLHVETIGPGAFAVVQDGRRTVVHVAEAGDVRWAFVDGHAWQIETLGAGAGRAKRAHAGDLLSAPMPGTVVKLLVEPGARVAAGDVLIVLEAMKMELPIRAPHDGRVVEILCAPGELVQPGVALVSLEP
jgi:3-methylcrotonyl-CoA carboxylase alpha subunit